MKNYLLTLAVATAGFGCLQSKDEPQKVQIRYEIPSQPPPPVRPPPRPGFITGDAFEDLLVVDAQSLGTQDGENAFYLNGCDRFNLGEEMTELKQAIDKGINMLSTERFIQRSVQVGPCAFRIDQDDYGISDRELGLIAANGLFTIVSQSIRGQTIQAYLQKEVTWMFADDFVISAFEADQLTSRNCDIYCDIVEQRWDRAGFLAQEGIADLQAEYDNEDVLLLGTNESPIAFGGRIIEFYEGDNGVIASANDSSLANPVSITANPFTLEAALAQGPGMRSYYYWSEGDVWASEDEFSFTPPKNSPKYAEEYSFYERLPVTEKIFFPVAREYIYSLPNGLQGFRLESAVNGLAASAAPADVVQDNRNNIGGLDRVIRIGSCSGCHSRGPVGAIDEIGDFIARTINFNQVEKDRGQIFFNQVQTQRTLDRIAEAHLRAQEQTGSNARGRDPLNGRLIIEGRLPYDAEKAAAKFMMTVEEYRECIESSLILQQNLGAHLENNSTVLQVLAAEQATVVAECRLFREIEI